MVAAHVRTEDPRMESPTQAEITAARTAYDRDGFVVVRGVMPSQTTASILEEYDRLVAAPLNQEPFPPGPRIAFWRHVVGGRKRQAMLADARHVSAFIRAPSTQRLVRGLVGDVDLRVFECVVFDKPAEESTLLPWHQDCAFYPFDPANQISVWVALDPCSAESGAVHFAAGSHRGHRYSAVDLQSGARRAGDAREEYPDPAALGYDVRAAQLEPGDAVIFNVRTWHFSPPNKSAQKQRRGLAMRFLVGPTRYAPTEGNAAGFISQIEQAPGEFISGAAFPLIGAEQS